MTLWNIPYKGRYYSLLYLKVLKVITMDSELIIDSSHNDLPGNKKTEWIRVKTSRFLSIGKHIAKIPFSFSGKNPLDAFNHLLVKT